MKKLTISLVTYNSERFLHEFCERLLDQRFRDWELFVIDNDSSDDSVKMITDRVPSAKISMQQRNLGFSRAHNLNIAWSSSEYVLVVNPDVFFDKDCVAQLVRALDRNSDAASVGAKLLDWNSETATSTGIIDSCGLVLGRNYRVTDRYQGKPNRKIGAGNVFGISGALVMFRKTALDEVKVPRPEIRYRTWGQQQQNTAQTYEYFDEDFFAYKEDADLAWRCILAGWKHYFVPQAIAYHQRATSAVHASWKDRKNRRAINRYSYRNHLLMLYKNHFWSLTLRNIFSIIAFELGKFLYLAFLDRSSIQGFSECIKNLSLFRKKRKYVLKLRRIAPSQFKQWIS